MTDKPKLTGQGGPGRGQGRPKGSPNSKPKRVRMSFRLSPEIAQRLKQEKDYTALIEKLLKEHYGV